MIYDFYHLSDEIRTLMVQELNKDCTDGKHYLSKNFNSVGKSSCFEIAKYEILNGDEESFSSALISNKCFDAVNSEGRTVPKNAADLYAHNEFNRFYMRALALKAIKESKKLEIYRAKVSSTPRSESDNLIGCVLSPNDLLFDLRENHFIEKAFGLAKPNSGLSVKII